MVNLLQIMFSVLSAYLPTQLPLDSNVELVASKSVAIIGGGSAGLAMLKTLLDLPEYSREGWEIVLYEEREDAGGIWLPDHNEVSPPEIPKTPLYPRLHTNTPVPSMSYPGFPFPPGTPLYPRHEHVEAYHRRYARHHNLYEYINFNHAVHRASWTGTPQEGRWNITFRNPNGHMQNKAFHHLVVASGNNHIPRIPIWKGQDEWLSNTPRNGLKRLILHSVYYRESEAYANQTVLVVGNGASGRDIASQVSSYARETYMSVRNDGETVNGVQVKPEILHFSSRGVVFKDNSILDPDIVLLGTGYELQKPFLYAGNAIISDPSARDNSSVNKALVTNSRYIFPLYRHILSLDPSYPTNALAFIGLPTSIANCPSDIAQSLFVANVIRDPTLLPPRPALLSELAAYEESLWNRGYDPYVIGHRMLNGTPSDYQDDLVDFLKDRGAIPNEGPKFVERWRRDIFTYQYLKRGWQRIEGLGIGAEWTNGVETEAQWADLMKRVNDWQRKWENKNGVGFRVDLDLVG
ncbi:hypothetical protein B0H34DRAFT_779609 [Crassisporium funariophilum]|nr:hypothetical protein B0H34DRAFT_779609 [Crassisporium funariophilum]